MTAKPSEALWLASELNVFDCDWKLRYLKGLRGVFRLMYGQVGPAQWKNNCSIYKGPFSRRGSSVSLTGTQTACPATMNSLHHKIWTHNYLFPPFYILSYQQRCPKSDFKFYVPVYRTRIHILELGPNPTRSSFHLNPCASTFITK